MSILRSLVTIALLADLALPAAANQTVFVPADQECSEPATGFTILGFRLGDTVSQVESRKDCTFHKQLPGPQFPQRKGALSREGEMCLSAYDPAMHKFTERDSSLEDCSHLRFENEVPDVLFGFFEKESETGMPVLNELFVSIPSSARAPQLVCFLEKTYGAPRRKVLPNHTVEYQWSDSKSALSLFVMLSSSCIYLQTLEKLKKSELEFGARFPGFSVEFAKEIEKSGRSLMAESEKNNAEQKQKSYLQNTEQKASPP